MKSIFIMSSERSVFGGEGSFQKQEEIGIECAKQLIALEWFVFSGCGGPTEGIEPDNEQNVLIFIMAEPRWGPWEVGGFRIGGEWLWVLVSVRVVLTTLGVDKKGQKLEGKNRLEGWWNRLELVRGNEQAYDKEGDEEDKNGISNSLAFVSGRSASIYWVTQLPIWFRLVFGEGKRKVIGMSIKSREVEFTRLNSI